MRKSLAPTLLAVALAGFSGAAALATDIQKAPAPESAAVNAETRRQRQLDNLMRRYEKLGLTEDQKNQIRPLLRSQLNELRAVRMDTNLTDETRQLQARSILEGYRTQISAVLTPEQKVQLQELREANLKAAKHAGTVTRRDRPVDDDN